MTSENVQKECLKFLLAQGNQELWSCQDMYLIAISKLGPGGYRRVSQMQVFLAACCELAGDYNRLLKVLIVF